MIQIAGWLKTINQSEKKKNSAPHIKMLLQVHDELVFEVPDHDLKKVAEFVKKEMENIFKLRVPIKVEVEAGDNWGQLKEI